MDTKNSDVGIDKPDTACEVVPIGSQVSKTTISCTRVKNDIFSSTVSVYNMQGSDIPHSSQNDNISLFSQPNAVPSPHLIDVKANVNPRESMYSTTAIPLHVWQQRFQCVDYQCCIQQSGFEFGAVPLTPIKLYEGKQMGNQPILDIIQLHNIIRQSNCPNFWGCRIPVQNQLKPGAWRHYLQDYWDQQLPDLIEYGFPIDFDRFRPLVSAEVNHVSGHEYGSDIESYLEEIAFGCQQDHCLGKVTRFETII